MEKEHFLKRLSISKPSAFQTNNYDLLLASFKAVDKIPIQCLKHGVFYQTAISHLSGQDCPTCGRLKCDDGRANTTEDIKQRSIAKFGEKFDYSKTIYSRQDVEMIITCPTHGDVEITFKQHMRSKHGCQKCDYEIPRLISLGKMLDKAKIIHNDKYDYSKVKFVNANDKVEIICPEHGSFWQGLYAHTVKGNKCPNCNKDSEKMTQEDFIARAITVHGEKYDYSKVEYRTRIAPVIVVCKTHGEFSLRPGSHLEGIGCKACFLDRYRSTTEEFIRKAKEIHGDTYDYSKVKYRGNKRPVEIVCRTHGSFWQRPNSHLSTRCGCRFCSDSKGEKEVETFLKKYSIGHIREYRVIPYRFRYDFFIPELNIFIEYHGLQHYQPVDIFGGEGGFEKTRERDEIKKRIAIEQKASLIVLSYHVLYEDKVETELIRCLRRIYRYWFVVGGKLQVFRTSGEVCDFFKLPRTILVKDVGLEAEKSMSDVKYLF